MASDGLRVCVQSTFIHVRQEDRDTCKESRSRSVPVEKIKSGSFDVEVKYANNLLTRASNLVSPKTQQPELKLAEFKRGRSGIGAAHRDHDSSSDASTTAGHLGGSSDADSAEVPDSSPYGFIRPLARSHGAGYAQNHCGQQLSVCQTQPRSMKWAGMPSDCGTAVAQAGTPITTLMLCDMPCRILHNDVIFALDQKGFAGKYDFLRVPTTSKNKNSSNLGYAFINFVDEATASCFTATFTGYRFPGTQSSKVCTVKAARLQGFEANSPTRSNRV